MPNHTERSDVEQIRRAAENILARIWQCGGVVELRALNTSQGIVSGYFDGDHEEDFLKAAAQWSGRSHGVYTTLNPVRRDCLARAANRATVYAKTTTGDAEITHRLWLLVDTDPTRPSGISATDEEHNLALKRAIEIRSSLSSKGFPDPLNADSGNGGHLLYAIDLPADDGGLVQRFLQALNHQFGDKIVGVDLKVHNPSRISKLYGTLACKGDSVPERPHRLARLIDVPASLEVVPRELLESIAMPAATAKLPAGGIPAVTGAQFDVPGYLHARNVLTGKSKALGDGATLWELARCPWRPAETDGGPFVIQLANGKVTAGCHHSHCDGKGWDDLRDLIDPGWRDANDKKGSRKGPSVAQQIVALAAGDELFHTAEKEAYVTTIVGNHCETWRVNGEAYRLNLRGRLHETGIVANKSALDDAVATLESKAIFSGQQHCVHVRTAQHDGHLYIDLCNEAWEAVEVSSEGWRIVAEPPVRFVRNPGMAALPMPVEGGNVSQLREFINVTDADWPLTVAWLMAALRPTGPYPILLINGEQGSCKSTTCRRLRSLIDPNTVPLRDMPKNEQNLMICAKNAHVIALDNLSSVSKEMSNAMCRVATGGGHSERSHYSNDAETLFYAVRPQMLNGIADIATRSDFLDRSLWICLPIVPKSARKTEKELDERFAQVHASVFGALLTAAAHGLKQLPEVEQMQFDLPRLADFAHWIIAVESALGWEPGTFMRAMDRNQNESHELAIASSPAAEAVRKLIVATVRYDGTWTELLKKLITITDESTKRQEGWPKNVAGLSCKIRESAPNLRATGIQVEFFDKERPKRVTLQYAMANQPVYQQSGGGAALPDMGLYMAVAMVACFANDPYDVVESTLKTLVRFWIAPPVVAAVAASSLSLSNCDGAQVLRDL